ncbi:MAG TPA: Trp biosynthesis-associated membrane protein [Pseudonocardiaceae bacterium]
MVDREAGDRRVLWLTVVLLLAAAALLWGSSRMTWWATVDELPGGGGVVRRQTGGERVPALLGLAVLAVAAVAAVAATGGWWRRVLGVLVLLAGVGAVWPAVTSPVPTASGAAVAELEQAAAQVPWARAVAGLGGALLLAAGVALLVRGQRMPRMGAKYQPPGGTGRSTTDPGRRMWDALDAGEDPTLDGDDPGGRT